MKRLLSTALLMGFLLGIHEGRLTLWRDGQAHPEQVYDIRADTLPPADRILLRRGIRAETREELWQILENYLD
ncbi:MAG: hypothetical protein E7451_03055 [Ruminococcaceae bacterium]|nr:hypothetical protein [Oscillospiraceae bacterium]